MAKTKKQILIIEDDEMLADIYSTKLRLEKYDVIHADQGLKGLQEAVRNIPDIILLDVVLPKMDGFEVLEQLKKNDKTKKIPVVVLSNLGEDYEIEKGMKTGADKYLVKAEYTPAEVIKEVKKILS